MLTLSLHPRSSIPKTSQSTLRRKGLIARRQFSTASGSSPRAISEFSFQVPSWTGDIYAPLPCSSWAVAKDLSRLLPHEIEAYINEPSKKNTELKRGYEIALNPGPWEEELLRKQEEIDAAVADEEEGVDQLEESDGEEEVESDADSTTGKKKKKSQAGKKRKRDSVSAEEQKKKRKSAQESLSAKRRPLAGTKKASKNKASSTEQIESEDGGAVAGDGDDSADATSKKPSGKGSKSKATAEGGERPNKKNKKDKEDDDVEDCESYPSIYLPHPSTVNPNTSCWLLRSPLDVLGRFATLPPRACRLPRSFCRPYR